MSPDPAWRVALGLYSVWDDWQADPPRTLAGVAELGVDGLELYGDPVMSAADLARALADVGLANVGWHTEWRRLQPDTRGPTLDAHAAAGTACIIVPALGGPWEIGHARAEDGADVWRRHAEALNVLAADVEDRGMRLGYHTHEHEFEIRYADGSTPFSILCEDLDTGVVLEVDTGNCLAAGVDPATILAVLPGRIDWVHAKPWSPTGAWETTIGAGDDASDWPAILAACAAAGTRWLVVEHESRARAPGLDGARACLEGLRRIRDA